MTERFKAILAQLTKGVYEKDTEIGLSLLAAIAGESVLLLGPPGVAKSMVARRIKMAFSDARSFEYLMSRFSTPDEIFGPVSISRLKTSDLYERKINGFMPTADVVFLDEVWKAGPAILNTLLTIINEKTFHNGTEDIRVPMKLLIGASNELPADGEGLEALWDRFLVRMVSGCVKNEDNFYRILQEESVDETEPVAANIPSITNEEYTEWQKAIATIGIDKEVLAAITAIRRQLPTLRIEDTARGMSRVSNIYVSDRRWKHIVHLLRASAFVHGRKSVNIADLMPLVHCLWNDPDEIPALRSLVATAAFDSIVSELNAAITAVGNAKKKAMAHRAMKKAMEEGYTRDDNKQLFNSYYYLIDDYGKGNTFIFFVDYKNLKDMRGGESPTQAVIYTSPNNPKIEYIRSMADAVGLVNSGTPVTTVKLYRDDNHIYINGVRYAIRLLPRGQVQPRIPATSPATPTTDYEALVEKLSSLVRDRATALTYDNMFASAEDKAEVEQCVKGINHDIAQLRLDIQKLLYEE